MGDDDQKRNGKKKRSQPQENDVDQLWEWPDFLADDDLGIMGDFPGEFDAPNYEGILTSPITLDSSSKYGFLSSVTSELESPKRRRDSDIVPVSVPKPFDPKQKGVAILPEWEPTEPRPMQFWEEGGSSVQICEEASSVQICACCLKKKNDQQLLILAPCEHYICHRCLGEKIVKGHPEEVNCPGRNCKCAWKPEHFGWYVRREVFDRWLDAAREARALANLPGREFACPFCGATLIDNQTGFLIRACTVCWRIFCMNCLVPWHLGVPCWVFMAGGYGHEYDDVVTADLLSSISLF